jgi:uncharacterized membrane protein YfcA
MLHILIGLIVGLIMGLTGAGGALVAIPLFLELLNMSLKEATILSLAAVILGTITNLFGQKYPWDKKIVIHFVIFGAIANYASLPLKALIPDLVIALLLTLIAIFSIWSIWKKSKFTSHEKSTHSLPKLALFGMMLGLITTLTGLGGGVLLIPILMRFFGKSYEKAMPTSLATILLISATSFVLQWEAAFNLITYKELSYLAVGAMVAFFVLKYLLNLAPPKLKDLLRRIVFTGVAIYSISSVVLKSF